MKLQLVLAAIPLALASYHDLTFDYYPPDDGDSIIANPEPNATSFTLDNLNRHNVLEHDASLSRSDAYFGNNHVFNQTVFDTTKTYWREEILDRLQLANSKLFCQVESRTSNPNYTSRSRWRRSVWVSDLGWSKKVDAVTLDRITRMSSIIAIATSLFTESTTTTTAHKRRDLHAGL
ncbi:putative Chloroperoxidase [Seiridium unicorne]|uniref:Chloroperoxidase n=1 Tax=Seiridium unicorne TaxID=138068 RepID=A0ABR2UGV0_9PEZI